MELDNRFWLAIIHLVVVVPLFLYVGFMRAETPDWIYLLFAILGAIIALYHGMRMLLRLKSRSSYWWINAIHLLLVAPLLLFIGYHRKNSPRMAYESLLMLAFAALGYHMFSLVKMMNAHPEPNK
jgi:lipoprotein signal peptidase